MTTPYRVIHPITGLVLYAYPVSSSYPLSAYATHRVLLTETDNMYEGQIDLTKSDKWVVFEGTSIPADYDEALFEDGFVTADAISGDMTVTITPASFSAINRGDKSTIRLFNGETKLVTIPVNADYTATDIVFVVENKAKTAIFTVANGSLLKSTSAISVVVDTTVTNYAEKKLNWSIRTTDDNEVLVYGTIDVDYAALV